jgi:hypothetical protein
VEGKRPGATTDSSSSSSSQPTTPVETKAPESYELVHDAIAKSTVFTNGECIAILYPPQAASIAFKTNSTASSYTKTASSANNIAVAQVFSLQTGEMLEEKEYEFEPNIVAACVTPNSDGVWIQTSDQSQRLQKYNLHPPASVSKWRLARMKDKSDGKAFPSARKLAERYPLPDLSSTCTSVDLNTAIMCILERLHQVSFTSHRLFVFLFFSFTVSFSCRVMNRMPSVCLLQIPTRSPILCRFLSPSSSLSRHLLRF